MFVKGNMTEQELLRHAKRISDARIELNVAVANAYNEGVSVTLVQLHGTDYPVVKGIVCANAMQRDA